MSGLLWTLDEEWVLSRGFVATRGEALKGEAVGGGMRLLARAHCTAQGGEKLANVGNDRKTWRLGIAI